MPAELRVPPLGESVVEATISRWLKQEGDSLAAGEPVVELETDKVSTEISAEEPSVLERIVQREGATVHVGDVLAVVAPRQAAPAARETVAASVVEQGSASTGEQPKVRASPVAERLAGELGVDLGQVPGRGRGGRIMKEDVVAYAQTAAAVAMPAAPAATAAPAAPLAAVAAPAPAPAGAPMPGAPRAAAADRLETRQRLSRRRLTIARRLVEAQHTAAMLTTFNEVDMSAVAALRQRRREAFRERHGVSLGYTSFFVKALVGALRQFPALNAEMQGDELVLKHYYDIGIAVGDPEGLVVPVLRGADHLTFGEIEQGVAGFVQRARDRTLTVDDLRGGTFTVTNGGVFGSLLSTPILNPPQVGVLGMHKIQDRAVVLGGQVVVRPMMYVALTYDHRVVDGREAVQFLVRVKELVEDPASLLLEG